MANMNYRGLTIRIGGDTAPLQRAIKEVSSAARTMQGQLRAVNAGLKLDPANVALLTAKMSQLGEKAILAGSKASILQGHLNDLPRDAIERAEQSTGELGARAALAAEDYQRLNEQIAEMRRKLAMEKYLEGGAGATEKEIEEAIEKYKQFEAQCKATGERANDELYELQQRWHAVRQELETATDAVKIKGLTIEIDKLKAEAKQAAIEFVEMKDKMLSIHGSDELVRARTDVRRLGDAADETKGDIHELDAALKEGGNTAAAAAGKYLRLKARQDQLEDKAQALRVQMRELNATLEEPVNPQSLAKANAEFLKAKENYTEIKVKADAARAEVARLNHEMALIGHAQTDEAKAELKKLGLELDQARMKAQKLEAEENELEREFTAAHTVREISKVELELRKTTAQAHAAGAAMKGISAKNWYIIRSVGTVLMSTITPALSMGLQKIADASDTLDASWRNMRKTVNGTEEDFAHLKEAAIEFSKTHVTTADQILEIEAMGGQLGIVVEDLEAFATTVANLDISTNMDSDTIAEDLGKLANILGMSVEDYDNFGDALVRLGNNEAALEGDVMKITTRYAGMGKIVGMSADQILAWATAATATGQKAEAAGSSMQRFVSNMETAVNGSEEDLAKWAKVAGMTGEQFKKSFGEDASGTMYKFIEGLANIQKSGGSVNQKLMELGITGVRDKQLLEGLAQQMVNATDENNVLRDSLEMSSNAWNGISDKWGQAGDAMNEAEKKSQGFSGSLGKLKNTATALAASAGDSLVPWMNKLTAMLGGLEEAYSSLPDGTKQVINGIGAIVTAMGPMMMVVGAAGQGFTSLKKNMAENSAAAFTEAQSIQILYTQREIDNKTMMRNAAMAKRDALAKEELTAATRAEMAALEGEIAMLNGQIRAQERAIIKTKAYAAAMKALKMIGITAAIMAAVEVITILIGSYAEAKRRADLFAESQAKMNDLLAHGFSASKEVEEVEKVSKSLKELQQNAEDAAEANVEMANNFSANMQEAYDKGLNIDDTVGRIQNITKSIGESGKATKEQLNDLKTAVNQLNEATGTNWFVNDKGEILDQQRTMSDLVGSYESLLEAYNKVHGTDLALDEDGKWDESVASLQDLVDAVNQLNDTDFVIDENGNIVSASGDFEDMAVKIDDVITKTDELREAQKRLWAEEAYHKSAQEADENKRKSRQELEEGEETLRQMEEDAEKIKKNLGEQSKEYQDAAAEIVSYRGELAKLRAEYEDDAEVAERWKSNQEGLEEAIASPESIEAVITKFDELGEVLVPKGMGIEDLADAMKGLGLTFDDLADLSAEDVEKIVDDWDGKMPSLIKNLQDAGVKVDETTVKMADMAEQAGLTAPQISDMWDAFGGDVDKVQAAIEVLNETDIDPKKVKFEDNAFVVEGHISDVDRKKIEDKGFTVDDGGTIDAEKEKIYDLNSAMASIQSKSVTLTVNIAGYQALMTAGNVIGKLAGKTFSTGVSVQKRATGAIVKNARGRVLDGQVVTRPTMTNIGIVGEAGSEWVGDGKVIPLTNRKYMVPIAREIAAGLNTYNTGRNVNVSVSLNYSAGADANQMATDLTRALRRKILMEG